MDERHVVVVGGGAAGFFAAIACAEGSPGRRVLILDKGSQFLSKVRISGGGRCNVTHACFDPRELSSYYPRGGSALRGPFTRFQPRDTVAWFEHRGVPLKTEPDGRIFPVSDSSLSIVNCLLQAAKTSGVEMIPNLGVERVTRRTANGFELTLTDGQTLCSRQLLLATGGCRGLAAGALPVSLGHSLEAPVPSLFSFQIASSWLKSLAGISLGCVEVEAPGVRSRQRGAILITHAGVSGPAILRLSAWGARELAAVNYNFPLKINWLPDARPDVVGFELDARRASHPARLIVNTPYPGLAARLWEQLVLSSGIPRETRWAELSRFAQHRLIQQLCGTELPVVGKSLNKDEFVTCGGVRLGEVNFKTMESRLCPGLYFGGELLDLDGLTGGFNFQAAWTTGWIAGRAMSQPAG